MAPGSGKTLHHPRPPTTIHHPPAAQKNTCEEGKPALPANILFRDRQFLGMIPILFRPNSLILAQRDATVQRDGAAGRLWKFTSDMQNVIDLASVAPFYLELVLPRARFVRTSSY